MKAQIQKRLDQLERAAPNLGARDFATVDGMTFFETTQTPGAFDYRRAILGADGTPPVGAQLFTQQDLNAFERAGWDLSIVHWYAMENQNDVTNL